MSRHLPRGMAILHEDGDILVVDKPAGLLTMGTDREKVKTACYVLTNYVRKGYAKSRKQLFVVHRLDRDTSGVLIFAKTEAARKGLQEKWEDTTKIYLAAVHGSLAKKEGTLSTYLAENRAHVVYSTTDPKKGKLSKTAYRVLQETKGVSLLEIDLITGRKNQIRVQLADVGHPVVGDKKYGKGDKAHKRLALHAKSISFKHPSTGKTLTCEAKVPKYITTIFA
jgi:tRNA pseudouridine32 synthase/23S rRNA pseudouridine746 synthase/23S rRNA pseudouridine1911/1915/1917 synthase